MNNLIEKNVEKKEIPKNVKYFKQEIMSINKSLNSSHPNIKEIVNILISPEVISTKLIESEIGHSYEGQNSTGYNLLVELNLKEKLVYIDSAGFNSYYSAYFEIPKTVCIVLPPEVDGKNICSLYRGNRLVVTPFIEAVKARALECRTIHQCILLFVNVEVCT